MLDGSKWVVLDYMNEMINGEVNISQMFKPLMKLVDGEKWLQQRWVMGGILSIGMCFKEAEVLKGRESFRKQQSE